VIVAALGALPAPAAFPGANGQIAFQTNRDGNYEIYSMNPDGSSQTDLTNNPASDAHPAWSPDGTKIAFQTERDGNSEVYAMNAGGSGQINLTNSLSFDYNATWSPDGTKIAFVSDRDGDPEIFTMNADGSGQTQLTFNSSHDDEPSWSPDGTKIAYINQVPPGVREIFAMNPDGSGQTNLTANGGFNSGPDWSPDGTQIAYHSGAGFCGPNCEIFTMNADGSGQTNLTNNPASDAHPTWSPDGTKIAFGSTRDVAPEGEIYTMNPNGSDVTRLTNNGAVDDLPAWQPLASDTTPPTIALNMPTDDSSFLLGETVLADYSCQDEAGGSGLASCVGNVPAGAAIDTASVGTKTFAVNATDNAGNPALLTHDYSVVYDFSGFFSPVDNLFTPNAVKAGSAVPVKFSLGGNQGLAIFAASYPKSEQTACSSTAEVDGIESTAPAGSSGLVYNPLTRHYVYVWLTKKAWANTCRQLVVKLNDGTSHRANFQFK
jgi:TolB protein